MKEKITPRTLISRSDSDENSEFGSDYDSESGSESDSLENSPGSHSVSATKEVNPRTLAIDFLNALKEKDYEFAMRISDYTRENLMSFNAKVVDSSGKTALHYAAMSTHEDVVILIDLPLWNKADINALDKDGETPLHAAAKCGNLHVVKILLRRNADVNLRNKSGKTARDVAQEAGHREVVEFLGKKMGSALSRAEQFSMAREDDSYAARRESSSKKDLPKATKKVNLLTLEADFLDALEKQNYEFATQISDYVQKNSVFLSADKAKPESGKTALHYAAMPIREELYKKNLDLLGALCEKSLDFAKFLIKHEANVNVADRNTKTPLHMLAERPSLHAAQSSSGEKSPNARFAELLIEHGADVNAADYNEETPLHVAAAKRNNLDVVKALFHKCSDRNKEAALLIAQKNHNQDVVEFLKAQGVKKKGSSGGCKDTSRKESDSDARKERDSTFSHTGQIKRKRKLEELSAQSKFERKQIKK